MNNSGFTMNSNKTQSALDSFIKNRVTANIPKKKPIGGIQQDPIERQAMSNGLQSTIQKYKTAGEYKPLFDAQQPLQQPLQGVGEELSIGNQFSNAPSNLKRAGQVYQDFRRGEDGEIFEFDNRRARFQPKKTMGRRRTPPQEAKNTLSDTLMRYLQGMFNGGF